MSDASGDTVYCYDRRGNVLKKTQLTGTGNFVVSYTYDKADRLATLTYPSGAILTYGRDAIGRITSITRKPDAASAAVSVVSNASYYPFGPLNQLTYGNGRSLTKTYDQDYAIDQVVSSDPNGLVLDFTTDVMGNIVDASDTVGAATKTRKYVYDHLYRLKDVTSGLNTVLEDYAYNATGDRTSKQLGTQAPQVYDYLAGTHRLGSVDGVDRDYDDNGNLISINTGRAHPEYQYDDRNRMSASLYNGATLVSYTLNGRGERVGKTVPGLTPVTHQFVYDEAGHLLGQYVVGVKLTKGTETLYLDGTPVATTVGGSLSYLETDHLGTPRIAANPTTNAQQWKWDFFANAFGDNPATVAPSGGIDVPLRYPGQLFDAETGLHYNYCRDYEPGTGRYVESDPIGLEGGASTFAYVGQNPFVYSDPLGLDMISCALSGKGCSGQYFRPTPPPPDSCGCIRMPDYLHFQVDFYIFSANATFTRNLDVFAGGGVNRSYPNPVSYGVSIANGWMLKCNPTPAELNGFLGGFSGGGSAFAGFGGGYSKSPSGSGFTIGVGAGYAVGAGTSHYQGNLGGGG